MNQLFFVALISLGATALWLLWQLVVRPYGVSSGMIPPTAYDYTVRGWKAERRGRWSAALAEYDKALEADPRHQDAQERRTALLEAHPELSERAGPGGPSPA